MCNVQLSLCKFKVKAMMPKHFRFYSIVPSLNGINLELASEGQMLDQELRNKTQIHTILTKDPFICCKVVFFWKVNSGKVNSDKVNYFLMFGSVMKNKLENIFQCLVMSWKMS